MKLKNQIVNYFVAPPSKDGQMPRVFISPVTMNAEVGRTIIQEQLKKKNDSLSATKLLHVCLDLDSGRVYVPNASDFSKEQMENLLKAAEVRITIDHGNFSSSPPIEGSPFSSLRARSVSGFGHTVKAIKEHFKDKDFIDLPVIEANLGRMPSTVKQLPSIYQTNKKFVGGYISPSFAKSITFFEEKDLHGKDTRKKVRLLTQSTPFILIDITPSVETETTEKEWVVLSGYRDFLYDKSVAREESTENKESFNSFADLFAIKRYLYLGWPFEEVCYTLLGEVSNFGELINGINALMAAVQSLQEEGYPNPASIPYYITFKIDIETFPIKLETMMDENNQFNPFYQMENFKIIEYDINTKYIIIETPAFISPDLCHNILKSINKPLITRYNPHFNTIDVKTESSSYKEYQFEKRQLAKLTVLTRHDVKKSLKEGEVFNPPQIRSDERTRSISLSNPDICHVRKMSEYFYATDHIKKMCKKNNIEFKDITVVVGPIERIFGAGIQGGYMGEKEFKKSKLKIPHELEKGLFVTPPIIAINSTTIPSYAKQAETLIHEYSHNLYSITNPEHEHLYNKEKGLRERDKLAWWNLYFNDADERKAHIEEIKHELIAGRSMDEIIRDKVGGAITPQTYKDNYPIALKFRELVEEAAKELEQEEIENEHPDGKIN